jgi:hypothetical protein
MSHDQDAFEQTYVDIAQKLGFDVTVEEVKSYRSADEYLPQYRYLNGCWDGWKLCTEYYSIVNLKDESVNLTVPISLRKSK